VAGRVPLAFSVLRQISCLPLLTQRYETDVAFLTAPAFGHLEPAVAPTVDIGKTRRQDAIATIFRMATS